MFLKLFIYSFMHFNISFNFPKGDNFSLKLSHSTQEKIHRTMKH